MKSCFNCLPLTLNHKKEVKPAIIIHMKPVWFIKVNHLRAKQQITALYKLVIDKMKWMYILHYINT